MPPSALAMNTGALQRPVEQHGQVELARDVDALGDQHLAHLGVLGPVCLVTSTLPSMRSAMASASPAGADDDAAQRLDPSSGA